MTRIRWFRVPARPRPARRVRLLAAAAPLALAGMTIPAAAASGHAQAATASPAAERAVTTTSTASGQGPVPLSLPGLTARTTTVTLITGDQVRLTEVSKGRYDATGIPGSGPASSIDFQGKGSAGELTSLQATPNEADALIGTGQVNPGLFDVLWLATHGDTGADARIPVTIEYTSHPGAAAMAATAARLPGATVTGTSAARGQVTVQVAASHAAAFWAALTGTTSASSAAQPAGTGSGQLAGGAAAVWLTGHDTPTANPAPQQAGQPEYPVTITYTRTVTGSLIPQTCGQLAGMTYPAALLCGFQSSLLGVAGGGLDNAYKQPGNGYTCVQTEPAKPLPLCTAVQATFTVPAGVYAMWASATFHTTQDADGTEEDALVEMDVPQFTVTGPTAITVNANDMTPVTVTTPQPARTYGPDSMGEFRTTQDGRDITNVTESLLNQGVNYWAVPTAPSQRATIGEYTLFTAMTMGAPLITAQVTAPRHLALHPIYPCDSDDNSNCAGGEGGIVRFSGSHTLQLVNAGTGTPAEFSEINARGKLALISPYEATTVTSTLWPGYSCQPNVPCDGQLAAAKQAGAAGVLFTGGDDGYAVAACGGQVATCWPGPLPTFGQLQLKPTDPTVPFALIDQAEAATLAGLAAKGPVTVTVTDHGETGYAYSLSFYQEGGIAASQHYTLTNQQLAEVTDAYDAAAPQSVPPDLQAWTTTDAPGQFFSVGSGWDFPGPPFSVRTYYGPLSPAVVWKIAPSLLTNASYTYTGVAATVFGQPGQQDMAWHTAPVAPGAFTLDPAAIQAQPGSLIAAAAASRQGNAFYPEFYLTSGASPLSDGDPASIVGFAPGSIQLYDQAGQELQASTLQSGAAYYPDLPTAQQRYKLVLGTQLTGYGPATTTEDTTWDFTSAAPASGDYAPDGYSCLGTLLNGSTDPCNLPPLVYLRYNANLTLNNTITPGTHQLQVTGYHQDPSAPPVTSLKLWTSTDGGTTWQPARVSGGRDGTFTAAYAVPASGTSGYVSIKAEATDAAGNDITQTITDAYAIAAATSAASAAAPTR